MCALELCEEKTERCGMQLVSDGVWTSGPATASVGLLVSQSGAVAGFHSPLLRRLCLMAKRAGSEFCLLPDLIKSLQRAPRADLWYARPRLFINQWRRVWGGSVGRGADTASTDCEVKTQWRQQVCVCVCVP